MMAHNNRLTKTALLFNRCFFLFYTGLFLLTLIGGTIAVAVFGELGTEYPMPAWSVLLRVLVLLLSFAGISAAFLALCRLLLSDKAIGFIGRRHFALLLAVSIVLMAAVQLIFAFCLQMKPITDIANLDAYAKTIVSENSFACLNTDMKGHYIVRYQNNLPLLLWMTLVYRVTYALTGSFSHIPLIVLNTAALNAAVWMTVLTARRLFGERKALLTMALCALFTPYYTYTPYFYTDSFSLPFTAGTVFAFTVAMQSGQRRKKVLFLLLSGALCFIGFELKASVVILLPALLIYLLLRYGVKRAAKAGAALLLSFAVLFGAVAVVRNAAPLISPEMSDRYRFPATHWVMMGLKDFGAFNFPDSDFTQSFPTMAEKQQATVEEIGRRAREKGVIGFVPHLGGKAVWTYMDGTYYIANYLENYQHWTPLHDFVLYEGKYRFAFFAYSFGYQMFLMAMIACSALYARRRGAVEMTTLFRIAVFGMVLFFLIWETNARYPFNFTPLYMLLATEGAFGLAERLKKATSSGRFCRKKARGGLTRREDPANSRK